MTKEENEKLNASIKVIKDAIMEEYNKNLESPYWIRETNVNGMLEEPTEILNIITKFQQDYTKEFQKK